MNRACLSRPRVAALLITLLLLGACRGGGDGKKDTALPELPPKVSERLEPAGEVRPVKELAIAWVGEVRGELEPCGCPTVPYGGFERRQNYLDQLRAIEKPVFHLDAGEALVKGLSSWNRADAEERALLIRGLMGEVGVDAFTPGSADLIALGEGWQRWMSEAPFPVISATWLDPATGALALPTSVVLERGGVKLGVIGLSGAPLGEEVEGLVASRDPVEAAREALAALGEGPDLVVALSNLDPAETLRVAEEVPGLAAVLSVRAGRHDPPRVTAGAPILETPDRGRYVTVLDLVVGSTPGRPLWINEEVDKQVHSLRLLRRRVRALEGSASPAPGALDAARAELAALEQAVLEKAKGRNLVGIEDRPLGNDLDGEAPVTAELMRFKGVQMDQATANVRANVEPDTPTYKTAAACTGCHSHQVAFWAYTPHKDALTALVKRGEEKNPECVACHTTGFGQPGGFAAVDDADTLRRFGGVQCESCHGPLSLHPARQKKAQPVSEQTCLGCHDEANSPDFDYETYLPRARCPSGA